ncbi:quinone oxidoreductase family protein [Sphingomonas profundi]|uniref:quinone oxidoreductase family protein n=1 Tax=Alterirhizorhabdus profundi TaxID=2681549 RepID=UPI0012E8FBD6|nr:zinc-binding alcohol dehydrogenase family protein [Sphingomonas profundi]
MKAAYYRHSGGPEVLEYGDLTDPAVGADTVLIRVEAISLEGGDLLNRRITPPPANPYVGGYQAAGTVAAVGDEVRRLRVGQRVVGFNWGGSHAALFAVAENHAYPIPDGMDLALAAVVPIAFGTASDVLFEFGRLQAGETVLVQGAAGGVGLAAVQLAKRAGARVIATASTDERLDRLAGFGADEGINYREVDIGDRVLELTGGKGCDLVVDLAGGHSIDQLMKAVRYRGRFAVVGASSGDLPAFRFIDIIGKSLTLYGPLFGAEMHGRRAHDLLARLMADVAAGNLRMPIARAFPLAEAWAAHHYAETGHPFGRVVLKVS